MLELLFRAISVVRASGTYVSADTCNEQRRCWVWLHAGVKLPFYKNRLCPALPAATHGQHVRQDADAMLHQRYSLLPVLRRVHQLRHAAVKRGLRHRRRHLGQGEQAGMEGKEGRLEYGGPEQAEQRRMAGGGDKMSQ